MFNKDFYPTPQTLVAQTLFDTEIEGKVVLEPNGGKGDAIQVLKNYGAKEVLTCEINPDLAIICSEKSDKFLKPDFLQVSSDEISHIDIIWMNPPFSADEKHILHAWEVAPEGCEIIALCNSETLKNTYSRQRKCLFDIVKNNGKSEDIGNVFKLSERGTDVNISIIKLYKPKLSSGNEFDGYFDMFEDYIESGDGIMKHNDIVEIVQRYVSSVKMYDSVIAKADEINKMTEPIGGTLGIRFGAYITSHDNRFKSITRDSFKKDLQKSAWRTVFGKLNMDKYLTRQVKDDINKFVEQQSNVPFTVKNIFKIIYQIHATTESRMNRVIVEIFDWLTQHHKDNRSNVEGWVTNEQYFVGKTFIMPHSGVKIGWGGQPEVGWGKYSEKMDDLTKALCFINGEDYNNFQEIYRFFQGEKVDNGYIYKEWGKWIDFNHFTIKVYKKGTMHCKFKDDKVWERFNLAASKAKGWSLPENVGSSRENRKNNNKKGVVVYGNR